MKPADLASHIDKMHARYAETETRLSDPGIYAHQAEFRALNRERGQLERLFALYDAWCASVRAAQENRELLLTEHDPELKSLIESDLADQETHAEQSEHALMLALIPPDRDDARDTIVEIRPAAGGEEAALFTAEMFRMYTKYAERRNWKMDVLDLNGTELGGVKDVTFSLVGDGVFSRLKYESGVHRVQRVPQTEASGRIHTSTITISVLPEASETDDIEIRSEDLEISTFRSSGPGGQNVNRTDSAVRIVHKPSGLVVASQQERSQTRNREIALRILKSKLLEIERRKEAERQAASKRSQVGTGDRSERVRTYNFPQNRITDHRFGVSAFDLPALMEGDLDLILAPVFEAASRIAVSEILGTLES